MFLSQKKKKELTPKIKAVLKEWGVKGTLSIKQDVELVLTLRKGVLDFWDYKGTGVVGSIDCYVNPYSIKERFRGKSRDFLLEVYDAMNTKNVPAFHSSYGMGCPVIGWFIDIKLGTLENRYIVKRLKNGN